MKEKLKVMTLEQLEELKQAVIEEMGSRKVVQELVLYTHECKNSAKYHLRKYKHWAKLLTAVDATKTTGYAFVGDWLNVNQEHKIPVGSIVVEVCGTTITAYKMTKEGTEKIDSARTDEMSQLIEKLAKMI